MLRRIFAIMERHHVQDTWPDYKEHYLVCESDHIYLVLGTNTSGERLAYLLEVEDLRSGGKKTHRCDLSIPTEFPLRWFVNSYRLTREYGGSEEGGWYWDCHTPLETIECRDEETAKEVQKVQNNKIDHEDQEANPYYGVNSPGHEYVQIENFDGTFNEPRIPAYE